MTEYERVKEQIKSVLKQIPLDIRKYLNNPDDAPSYSYYIDQILSLVEIKSDDQSLPEIPKWSVGTNYERGIEMIAQEDMLKLGFIKVAPKPNV